MKLFTVEEANALLPTVREIVGRIQRAYARVAGWQETTQEKAEERLKDSGEYGSSGDEPRAAGPQRGLLRDYMEAGAVVFVMGFFFMTFVAQSAVVPSASMENTIYVGDQYLVNEC